MIMLSCIRWREIMCTRVCEYVVSENMSRACSKQHLWGWDWPIKKERAQNEYTLRGWRTPHSFPQSLHLWGFLFLCAMTRKVVLLVSMKANYFPYGLCTLEWMCVSKCEYSLYTLQMGKCRRLFSPWSKRNGGNRQNRLIFSINCVLMCPGGQKSQHFCSLVDSTETQTTSPER